jgi:hypothetical protein
MTEAYRYIRDILAPAVLVFLFAKRAPWVLRALGFHLYR